MPLDGGQLDPMVPGLGSFELFDDDIPAREWVHGSPMRRALQALKVPMVVCGVLLLAAAAVLSFSVGGSSVHGKEAATAAPHPIRTDAQQQSSTSVDAGFTNSDRHDHIAMEGGIPRSSATSTSTTSTSLSSTWSESSSAAVLSTSTASSTTTGTTCAPSMWSRYRECQSDNSEVSALRCQRWPLEHKAPAPKITRALYINLDTDFRRRNWMEGQLRLVRRYSIDQAHRRHEPHEFDVERVSAVDIKQAQSDPDYEHVRQRGFNPTPYPNVMGKWSVAGCSLSHLKILRRMSRHAEELLRKREVWLILEDDAIVKRDIVADWEQIWDWLPEDWDILRLGWFGGSTCVGRVNDHIDLALWSDPPPSGPCSYCGSHAYIVNPASIQRVVHRIEGSKLMHVDCLLGAATPPLEDPKSLPELKAYAARPIRVLQNENFPSDRIS